MKALYKATLFICLSILSLHSVATALHANNPKINSCDECDRNRDRN